MSEGTLFVVATPIGNLDDLSPRAREVLAGVDLIAAEDTRVTGRLLSHFGITTRQTSLHEHNEDERSKALVRRLQNGESIALVSDAGTPLISDPGFRLIRAAHDAGLAVAPIPGASAFVAALSASGLPTDRFVFEGFLPAKKLARLRHLQTLAGETRPMVFYESVHRMVDTIDDLGEVFGVDRQAFVGRELTKLHEQCISASLQEIGAMLAGGKMPLKGEFVVIVAGASRGGEGVEYGELLQELMAVLPGKQAVEMTARLAGASRNEVYQRMLDLKAKNS